MSLPVASRPLLVTASIHRRSASPPSSAVLPPPPLRRLRRLPARCGAPLRPLESRRLANPFAYLLVSAGFLCARAFLWALPADFSERWRHLRQLAEGAEEKVTRLPHHLVQAVMASEDRRFLYHVGVDPWGIGRAVVYYPNGGGGSTITQQLVKNTFLRNERTISRKFVEGILSLILERRMSKWEILYSYLNKMYWGHGKYGIESASLFYFGKHPSDLHVGESALLAGILPSPETLNPFTNVARGKSSQARALRRMVAAGFLDLETALLVVSQPLCLRTSEPSGANQECEDCRKQMIQNSAFREIWDWEMASISWETREDMEKWAMLMHKAGR